MILLFNYSKTSFYANRSIFRSCLLPWLFKSISLLIASYVVILKHPNMKSPASGGFLPVCFLPCTRETSTWRNRKAAWTISCMLKPSWRKINSTSKTNTNEMWAKLEFTTIDLVKRSVQPVHRPSIFSVEIVKCRYENRKRGGLMSRYTMEFVLARLLRLRARWLENKVCVQATFSFEFKFCASAVFSFPGGS